MKCLITVYNRKDNENSTINCINSKHPNIYKIYNNFVSE